MNSIGILGDFKGLPFLNWQIAKHVSSAFTGNTPGTHGDSQSGGTAKPTYTIYTVTGDVIVHHLAGLVKTATTGVALATIEIGVIGNTIAFTTAITGTDLDLGDIFGGETDGSEFAFAGGNSGGGNAFVWDHIINNGADIIETTKTEDMDDGQIDYYCIWAPLEAGAKIVSAGTLS